MSLNSLEAHDVRLIIHAQALNRAALSESPHRELLLSTIGVVFLAAPLGGSQAAPAARWIVTVGGIMGQQVSDTLVRDLSAKTGVLDRLIRIFAENANASWLRLSIHCFYETQPTKILKSVFNEKMASFFSTNYTKKIVS